MWGKLFLLLDSVRPDVFSEVRNAMNRFTQGYMDMTEDFFKRNKEEYLLDPFFKKNYLEYLLSIGDYKTIIESNLDPEYTKKAKQLQQIINSNVLEEIVKLEKDSPYSVDVIRAALRISLINGDYKLAEGYVNKINRSFKKNKELMALAGQYYFLIGSYAIGIQFFNEAGLTEAVDEFVGLFNEYDEIKKTYSVDWKLKKLRSFYNSLNIKVLSDVFSPSIYTHVKFEILKEYLELAVNNRKSEASSLGKTYYVKTKDEYSRYLYIMSLIFDSNIPMAKKELEAKTFDNSEYARKIKKEIEYQEEQEKENKRQKSYDQRRGSSSRKDNKAGTDFLGYYKLLGVKSDATDKQIKKAYLKKVAMNKKKLKPDEWEKLHIKLNKALEILSNKKNREMYDKGIDPEKPQPQFEGFDNGFHFQGFEDLGAQFSDFFGGGSSFRGRRTQFVFL